MVNVGYWKRFFTWALEIESDLERREKTIADRKYEKKSGNEQAYYLVFPFPFPFLPFPCFFID